MARKLAAAALVSLMASMAAGCVYEAPPPPAYYAPGYYYPGYYYGAPAYGSVGVVFGGGGHGHWH